MVEWLCVIFEEGRIRWSDFDDIGGDKNGESSGVRAGAVQMRSWAWEEGGRRWGYVGSRS